MLRPKHLLPLAGVLAMAGCRQDMHDQPRYKPFAATDFFGDGRSARPAVEGTVARGHLRIDKARYTGKKDDGSDVNDFPFQSRRRISTVDSNVSTSTVRHAIAGSVMETG